jgi:hypothetical protein
MVDARHTLDERGLARTVVADETDDLTREYVEADVVYGCQATESLDQVA